MVTLTKKVAALRYHVSPTLIPKSLSEAAGLMKTKRKALEKHLETVRKEWK